jgi:hypothetical protein
VIIAGVGCPSGSIGKQSIAFGKPNLITSASAGDVSGTTSGFAPAADKPGILEISVPLINKKNIFTSPNRIFNLKKE